MPLPKNEFAEFEKLLNPNGNKGELECAAYLKYAPSRLFPLFPKAIIEVHEEHRLHFGRSDYFVVGSFTSDLGEHETQIYFWELKAPQCFLFELDDNLNRMRPTRDLVKAETQLIHYVEEARGSQMFLERFNVRSQNIKMGGIIIGRDDRIWNPNTKGLPKAAGDLSVTIRKRSIYDPIQIRIMTWDRIADVLRPNQEAEREV